jgi:hypothetical protein
VGFTVVCSFALPITAGTKVCNLFSLWKDASNFIELEFVRYAPSANSLIRFYWAVAGTKYSNYIPFTNVVGHSDSDEHYFAFIYSAATDEITFLFMTSKFPGSLHEYTASMTLPNPPAFTPLHLTLYNRFTGTVQAANFKGGAFSLFARQLADVEIYKAARQLYDPHIDIHGCWGHWAFDQPGGTVIPNRARDGDMGDAAINTVGDASWIDQTWIVR